MKKRKCKKEGITMIKNRKALEKSLSMTWQWFRNSLVMHPEDGSWGVGERVMLT